MQKNKFKSFFLTIFIFFTPIFITFLFLNFILIKISTQNIFPRPLAASLPNTLLTFYPDTYDKKNLKNFTAVLGNSVAQGNGDAYLQGINNYSISHHLYDMIDKNYLIFGRAGLNSISSTANLIKIHKLSNQSLMIPDLDKPDSIIFFLYEGIDLVWNHDLYKKYAKENETVEDFTSKIINRESSLVFSEKLYNTFPIIPFVGAFFEDFLKLFNEIFASKSLKESISLVFDRIKKLFGFYIVLGDKEKNDLTWTNSLKDHKNYKNIRPIQGASETLNKEQLLIGLKIFYESVKHVKNWSKANNIYVIYISSPITIYDWNEPIIYEKQNLPSKFTKKDIKTITNNENKIKNIFLREEVNKFSKKNNLIFLDPSEILIKEGKNKVLHGPLDWGHLNNSGYKIVSEFIAKKISQN